MLDVMLERLQKQGKQTILNRVAYVATLSANVKFDEINLAYEKFFKPFNAESDPYFGILLLFPNCLLHLLESTPKVINALLKAMNSTSDLKYFGTGIRVIASTEDIQQTAFQSWSCQVMQANPTEDTQEVSATGVQLMTQTYLNLLSFGKKLSGTAKKDEQLQLLSSFRAGSVDRVAVPTQLDVVTLTGSKEAVDLSLYITIYMSPIDIALETERVFPIRPSLKY